MNTKITYLYRDADNYKQFNEVIVNGCLTEEQKRKIISCLNSKEYFIPRQVCFPEIRFEKIDLEETRAGLNSTKALLKILLKSRPSI